MPGVRFSCDIRHLVPAAYGEEWDKLKINTNLWHLWRGDECTDSEKSAYLQEETQNLALIGFYIGGDFSMDRNWARIPIL